MTFDVGIKFSVETQELINARNALHSLAQAAKDLNNNQDKAANAADRLKTATEDVANAADKAEKAAGKTSRSAKDMAGETDAAAAKLQKLNDQLSYLRNDLNLSETGFTKSQAGILAWAKSVGASESIIKEFAGAFDKFNKAMGEQSLDKSVNGLSMLNRQLREFEQLQQLAKEEVTLTSTQVKMLARDMEILKQQNEAFNRESSYGVVELKNNFIEAAKQVNNYVQQAKEAEKAEKERAAVVASTAKANMDVMDQAVNKFRETEAEKTRILEANRKRVNDSMMQSWAGSVGQKSPELTNLASQYAEEEKQAMLRKAEATKAAAAADKIAADAIAYLERESSKLVATNDLLSRGFTQASANALYKYKEALQAAGVSTNELKQRLYTLEQDLMTKQQMSPFTKMREDMGKMQQDVKHLARAISVQLGDVFVSLASGQNLFTVMIQQGDQIRGALQQAKDANQDLSKAMQGAFSSMASSFKLVGVAIKDFVADGFNTVAGSMQTVIGRGKELDDINKRLAEGSITPLRAQRLEYVAVANAMNTLRIAALGAGAAVAGVLLKAFYDLSKEQNLAAQTTAQFGAVFGATSTEALEMAKSLRGIGISTASAQQAMIAMMKTGTLTKDSFAGIASIAVDVQKYVGISIDDVVKKFGELGKDPVKTLEEFTLQTGYLSQSQIDLVRSLVETGDSAKAQEVAISLLKEGYSLMASQAEQDMSGLGRAMVDLKSTTSTLWDEFKNSTVVELAIKGVKVVFDALAVSVHAVVSALRDVAITAGFAIDLVSGGPRTATEKWNTYTQALADNANNHNKFAKVLIEGTQATTASAAADRVKNVSQQQVADSLKKLTEANEQSVKSQVKEMEQKKYVQARIEEDLKKHTKTLTEEQRAALVQSENYKKLVIESEKRYSKEWEEARKKSSGSSGPKPKETYKVDRSNELAETKKFYDEQLKQIKDSESKQEASLKQSYDAKLISLGEYYAKQTELSLTSQKEQLAVINESSDKQKAAIQSRMLDHVAAFEKEVKAGGNVVALTDKLEAELANLTRTYGGVTQATDTQTQALQTATDKKFYEFYKEFNKNVNESKTALEKFSETVANNAANRQADLDLQRKLLGTYGAEAEALKASTSATRSYSAEIKKQTDLLKKQDELIAGLRKGRDGIADKTARDKVDQEIVKRLEERAGIEKNLGETTALAKQDAEQAAIDAVAAYNLKVFQEVRDTISGALYDAIFEGGSKGADALKNMFKNVFKSFVINNFIQPMVGNVVGSVMGAIGMGSGLPVNAGGGGIGMLGTAANVASLASSLTSVGGNLGAISGLFSGTMGLANAAGSIAANTAAMTGAVDGLSALLATNSAYGTAVTGTAAAGSAGGISGALSAIPGWGWALGAGALLLGSGVFGDLFSGGPPNLGSAYTYNTKTGASKQYGGPEDLGVDADKVTAQLMESTVTGINDLFKKLGSAAKVEDFWGGFAAREDGGDSAWAGGVLSNGVKFGQQWSKDIETELGSVEEAMKRYQEELSKSTLDALKQATDVPEYIQNKLKDVDIQKLTGEGVTKLVGEISNLVASVEGVNSSFELMGVSLDTASTKSGEYQTSLVESTGGIEAFSSSMSSYYENFYSESERSAKALESLTKTFADAGVEIPATREEYRKLVETAAAGGDATKDQLAFLLKSASAFAQLTPATSIAGKQITSLNTIIKRLGEDVNVVATRMSSATLDLFGSIGVSAEGYSQSIAQVFEGIITGKISGYAAGEELANAAINGITSAIASGASQVIAAQFVDSIITPIVANLLNGKDALEGVDMEDAASRITAQAKATGEALALVGPYISEGMSAIIQSVSSISIPSSISAGSTYNTGSAFGGMNGETMFGNEVVTGVNKLTTGMTTLNTGISEVKSGMMAFASATADTTSSMKKSSAYIADGNKWLKSFRAIDMYERYGEPIYAVGERDPYGAAQNPGLSEEGAWALKMKTSDKYVYDTLLKKQRELQIKLMELESGTAPTSKYQEEKSKYDTRMEYLNASGISREGVNSLYEQQAAAVRRAFVEEMRNYSMENLIKDKQDATATRAKAAELKLTGGLEDPITKLKEQYRLKLKEVDDGIGKIINEEIEILKNTKPWAAKIETYETNKKYIQSQIQEVQSQIAKDEAYLAEAKAKGWDASKYQASLDRNREILSSYQTSLGNLEQEYFDMVLAATSPEKQQALLDELAAYKGGVEEWFKAQAELMSTEMLIDINNQTKELETVEKGPLTTIKDAIQKYIDDFTELGTLTQEVQDAINKLSDLQLTKAREELYNQLLSEDELKLVQQTKLTKEFKNLGTELPASADALRAMIDAARAAGNITLADKLLELVPAFMALQGAAGGVSKELDEANKAFDAFKRSVEAQIKELEKTFTATDLAMRVLEKAVESEKKRLTEQLNTAKESVKSLKKIFDTLDKGIKDLRNEVDQTKQMQADEARRVIDVANLTGVLPDADRLSEAVSALTSSVQNGLYATAYDKSRAFLTLANDLEKLKDTTEPQLSSAEQTVVNLETQIEQLDDLLESARKQIDELRGIDASLFGIDESITLVDAALQQLQTAAQAEEQARKQIDVLNQQLEMYQKQLDALNGIDTSVKSVEDAIRDLEAAIASMGSGSNSGSTPGTGGVITYDGPQGPGLYVNGGLTGGVMPPPAPSYDIGTNYVPKDMLANIHEGEMIIPKRFNPSTSGLQQDNSELIEELQALRAEVSMLRAEARATAVNTSKTARILDDVTQGGDTLKTEVAV